MQIKATILQQTITVVEVTEATSLGAAILGGLGAGVYPDVASALDMLRYAQTPVEPVADHVALYEAYFQRAYQKIYPALRSLHHTIYQLQHE
jgi:xylulokinase